MPDRDTRRILGCGVAVAALPLLFGLGGGDPAARLDGLITGLALAGLPYLYIWRTWRRLDDDPATLRAILLVAALGRVALLAVPPLLSEDLWRYLWDGAVQWAGHNPFVHAPAAAALDPLAAADPALAAIRAQIGHAHIPTIYPPAAQLGFALATALGPHALVLRAALIAADLFVVLALWRQAARTGRRPGLAALYAFAPLAVVESAIGAHVDALGVAALVGCGALLAHGRPLRAGAALAVAIGTKLIPALALPTLARHRPRAALAALAAAALLWLPYLGAGPALFGGLRAYGERWRANDGLFALFAWPFEQLWPAAPHPVDIPAPIAALARLLVGPAPGAQPGEIWADELSFAAAKLIAGLVFAAVCLWRWWRARDLEGLVGPVFVALFLVSPVVHPWYLLWVLPFAALGAERRVAWGPAIIAWSLLAWIAYLPRPGYLATGEWISDPLWRAVEYLPVWALLAWGLIRARARRAGTRRCPSPP